MAMAKLPSYSWQCELSGAKQRLKYLFKTGWFSDIIITCPGGFTYKLHRMVLAMCSTVFEAMTFGPMGTLNNEKLCLEDNPEALKHVLVYCYGCDFQCDNIERVLEVFKIADKYMFNDLKSRCAIIIQKLIRPENFKMIYEFTIRYGFDELRYTCIRSMQQEENICTASAVLMWYSKNSPKDLLMPIFTVDKLIFDTWRNPKTVEPSDDLIQILQSNCCNHLQEFAGQVSGDVLKYIPGPLISTVTNHLNPSYAPKLKFSLQTNNANEVIGALHERYDMYGPEDIGIHIANEDIEPLGRMVTNLPCYNCDDEAEEFSPGRITLYLSDLTTESLCNLSSLLDHLTPECDEQHRFIYSYMFPRCNLSKEDLGTFYTELFELDDYYILPSASTMWMYSPLIEVVDEQDLWDSMNKCMRDMEIRNFTPRLKTLSSNNGIPGW